VSPADSDGGYAPSSSGTGPQTLKVEPSSIPGARDAFHEAADKIDILVSQLSAMDVRPWAGDPVSRQTAIRFAGDAGDRGTAAAIQALTKYGEQLRGSGDALHAAYQRYVEVEGTNTAKWKGRPVEA
jgi:hypothetical protein